ncbi:MAG TPA: DUF6616 family protein [Lentimicrobium sp.]|nr:DUF6616 family protein [Lentimicrobium sp.]
MNHKKQTMYLFIECWKAKQEWFDLSTENRAAYMSELGKGITGLLEAGVEIVSWGINSDDISNRSKYDYFGVWKFPDRNFAKQFELIIEQSGWYNYFDQVNLGGEICMPDIPIGHMIGLKELVVK